MFSRDKDTQNISKESGDNLGIVVKDSKTHISYTKINKLITALYMVTDILDNDEPLRNKLRTLGTEIISDINSAPIKAIGKIAETMSFLEIALAINLISLMNTNILRKEFNELNQAILDSTDKVKKLDRQINLSEFFIEEFNPLSSPHPNTLLGKESENSDSQRQYTRIGVQSGASLMKALNEKTKGLSVNTSSPEIQNRSHQTSVEFNVLKKQRQEDIKIIIKIKGEGVMIKDIKDIAKRTPQNYKSVLECSEKTLQRELVHMVKDNILTKTGEKRWSKYFLK